MRADREPFSTAVRFRVSVSQREKWKLAAKAGNFRDLSDFYRYALDAMADALLEPPDSTQQA